AHMKQPNQIDRPLQDVHVTAKDLLAPTEGKITEAGLKWNIDVGLQYRESWLRGSGCVPIYNLMEDAATAEICRSQVWQWVKHGATLADSRPVTQDMVSQNSAEQKGKLKGGRMAEAAEMSERMMTSADSAE